MITKLKFCFIVLCFAVSSLSMAQPFTAEQYIDKYKGLAVAEMKLYMIPASIILAQGLHESSNGNSVLAKEANNHFGIKCQDNWTGETIIRDDDRKDECFRKYRSTEESYRDHSQFIKSRARYSFLFKYKSDDYVNWANGLKTAGYATNPKYPQIIINTIEKYKLFEFDKEVPLQAVINHPSDLSRKHFAGSINNREIVLKYNIKAVIAGKGETYEEIAHELDVFPGQILRYNDLKKEDIINEGDIIYIQPKKRKAKEEFYIVKDGDTFREISQTYGIKLKCLLKKNRLANGDVPVVGEKLFLRKKKK